MVVVLMPITERQQYARADYMPFQGIVGDHNPLHFDSAYAATTPFERVIVPGFYALWRAEREGHLFTPGRGVTVSFARELRTHEPDQIGDGVRFDPTTRRYLRTRDGNEKTAITFADVDPAAPINRLEKILINYPLRNAKRITARHLRDLADGPTEDIPYTVAAALIAPALESHDRDLLGAYTEITLHPHARPQQDSALLAIAGHVRTTEQRGKRFADFEYIVARADAPNGFQPVVSGTVKLLELQRTTATHK